MITLIQYRFLASFIIFNYTIINSSHVLTKMGWFENLCIKVLRMGKIPKNIAIIMDGNRRYATKKNQEKHLGHAMGLAKLEQCLLWCL